MDIVNYRDTFFPQLISIQKLCENIYDIVNGIAKYNTMANVKVSLRYENVFLC